MDQLALETVLTDILLTRTKNDNQNDENVWKCVIFYKKDEGKGKKINKVNLTEKLTESSHPFSVRILKVNSPYTLMKDKLQFA